MECASNDARMNCMITGCWLAGAIASDKGFTPKAFENPVHWFDIDSR